MSSSTALEELRGLGPVFRSGEAVAAGVSWRTLYARPTRDTTAGRVYLDERRPTRDVDLLGLAIDNDAASVTALVAAIAAVEVDDGVIFRSDQVTERLIREQNVYAAVRVAMPAIGRHRRVGAEGRCQRG